MGVCIGYSGSFKKGASLKSLIEEVVDFAIANEWTYDVYNEVFDQEKLGLQEFSLSDIFGARVISSNFGSIYFTFTSNGKMMRASNLKSYKTELEEGTTDEYSKKYLFSNSIKTQSAGYEIHKKLCHFFQYLTPKYFNEDFELDDDTNYYYDNDEERLIKEFETIDSIISMFGSALDVVQPQEGESVKDFLEKVGNIVSNNLKDKLEGDGLKFEIRRINLDDPEINKLLED